MSPEHNSDQATPLVADPEPAARPPATADQPQERPHRHTHGVEPRTGAEDGPAVLASTEPSGNNAAHSAEGPARSRPALPKLRRGELPVLVLAVLRQHPGRGMGPTEIGRLLNGRSEGAVASACDRLVHDGLAELTEEKPRRFTAATVPATATPSPASPSGLSAPPAHG